MLIKKSSKEVIFRNVEIPAGFMGRLKGLIGRESLGPDSCVYFEFCRSVHTFFMKFPIDVVFLDRDFTIVQIEKSVPPGTFVFCKNLEGIHAIETKGDCFGNTGAEIGDMLQFAD